MSSLVFEIKLDLNFNVNWVFKMYRRVCYDLSSDLTLNWIQGLNGTWAAGAWDLSCLRQNLQ